MTFQEFKASLTGERPPEDLEASLQALWHQAKGDWDTAHHLAQEQSDEAGAWVHAHLHRVEGDNSNAAYWYRRAGKTPSSAPLQGEWEEIARALLAVQ